MFSSLLCVVSLVSLCDCTADAGFLLKETLQYGHASFHCIALLIKYRVIWEEWWLGGGLCDLQAEIDHLYNFRHLKTSVSALLSSGVNEAADGKFRGSSSAFFSFRIAPD